MKMINESKIISFLPFKNKILVKIIYTLYFYNKSARSSQVSMIDW